MKKFKILLVGATGFVGTNLKRVFLDHGSDVIPWSRSTNDMGNTAIARAIDEHGVKVIVNAAGCKDVAWCETHRSEAIEANVHLVEKLARITIGRGCKLVQISTDYVFAGAGPGPHVETSPPSARTTYGETKLQAESIVAALGFGGLVIRTGGLYGVGSRTLLAVHEMLKAGEHFKAFSNVVNMPTHVTDLATAMLKHFDDDASGILHLVGSSLSSRLTVFSKLADTFGYDKRLLVPISNNSDVPPNALHLKSIRTTALSDLYSGMRAYKKEADECGSL